MCILLDCVSQCVDSGLNFMFTCCEYFDLQYVFGCRGKSMYVHALPCVKNVTPDQALNCALGSPELLYGSIFSMHSVSRSAKFHLGVLDRRGLGCLDKN